MSAKTIAAFQSHARDAGHLSLVPPAQDARGCVRRSAPTLPPPADTADQLDARAAHVERIAQSLLDQSRELRAAAERMRRP